jgi:hypothetical protein
VEEMVRRDRLAPLARAQRQGASWFDSFRRHFGPDPRM